jgi:hypothetical protein
MTTRVLIPLVAAALAWCAVGGSATAQPLTPSVHVRIAPEVKDDVSGVAWVAMKAECQRIWLAEGVTITWDAQDPQGPLPDLQVPLVVHDQELRKHARGHADAFGVTVFAGRTQRVVVSIPRIRDMVSTRGRLMDRGDSMLFDAIIGRILGRVVAHEIGHVLLLSTWHAPTGLMSPALGTQHLGPSLPAFYGLSAPERARLANRFANAGKGEPAAGGPPPALARGLGPGEEIAVPVTLREPPRPFPNCDPTTPHETRSASCLGSR